MFEELMSRVTKSKRSGSSGDDGETSSLGNSLQSSSKNLTEVEGVKTLAKYRLNGDAM